MEKNDALFIYLTRLGDNSLILGHRLSEWCSKAPILEEDLALSNIALDLLGQANALLNHAGEIEGKGRDADALAYRRAERQFGNHLITELKNGDFGFTIARQLLYSVWSQHLYEALSSSKDEVLAGIAAKSLKEVKYHVRHAKDWTLRLGDGTSESHDRIQQSLNSIWEYTGELFETDEVEQLLVKEGIAADASHLKLKWQVEIKEILSEATLEMPEDGYMQTGGRKGIHTENLGFILAEMQYLQRSYPDAKW